MNIYIVVGCSYFKIKYPNDIYTYSQYIYGPWILYMAHNFHFQEAMCHLKLQSNLKLCMLLIHVCTNLPTICSNYVKRCDLTMPRVGGKRNVRIWKNKNKTEKSHQEFDEQHPFLSHSYDPRWHLLPAC